MNNVIIYTDGDELTVLDYTNVLCDISSNHNGSVELFTEIRDTVIRENGILKVQLYNKNTFPDTLWPLLPERYIPSVFRPNDIGRCLEKAPHRPLAWKIASVEATYYELIAHCMETKLPIIISTGGMNEPELIALLKFLSSDEYSPGLCLMHCVSSYPTSPEDSNLARIAVLAATLEEYMLEDVVLGWSSHLGQIHPIAYGVAVALGVSMFEVHVQMGHTPSNNVSERRSSVVLPHSINTIYDIIHEALAFCGQGEIEGVDRADVVNWRKRWQT